MRSVGTLIRYDGEVLGFVTATRVRYTAALERRAEDDPRRGRWLRRFVFAMGLYAIDVARGSLPAPYDDARAEHFARTFLIDDDVFRGCADRPDVQLADRFGVPVAQIALKRLDLAAEPQPAGSLLSRRPPARARHRSRAEGDHPAQSRTT
jgi:hypothetical protein